MEWLQGNWLTVIVVIAFAAMHLFGHGGHGGHGRHGGASRKGDDAPRDINPDSDRSPPRETPHTH